MMRFFCTFALGVLLCLTGNSVGETAPRVALEARIASERYCEVNEDFGSLLVKFEVKLANPVLKCRLLSLCTLDKVMLIISFELPIRAQTRRVGDVTSLSPRSEPRSFPRG